MSKKFLIFFLAVVIVIIGSLSVYLWLPSRESQTAPLPVVPAVGTTTGATGGGETPAGTVKDSQTWANEMVVKYKYEKGSYSGVVSAAGGGAVWIIGRRVVPDKIYPVGKYIAVENSYGVFVSLIPTSIVYSTQQGDAVSMPAAAADSASILIGDYVAVRATYEGNFAVALEMRELERR